MDEKAPIDSFRKHDQLALPHWYRWQWHLFLHALFFSISLSIGSFFFHDAGLVWSFPNLLFVIGFVFVWANIEYLIHRFVLHGSIPLFRHLAKEHSYNHHHYFTKENMHAEQGLDVNRILLMPWHLLGVLILNGTLAICLSFAHHRLAILFYFAGLIYSILYEVVHGLSHWQQGSRIPFLRSTLLSHQQHHDLKKMSSTNFSVVFPIIDFFWGTQGTSPQDKGSYSNVPN